MHTVLGGGRSHYKTLNGYVRAETSLKLECYNVHIPLNEKMSITHELM
jgi:hypothetical protein